MADDLKPRHEENEEEPHGHSRRDFLGLSFAAASGLALWPLLDLEAQRAACQAVFGQPLQNLGEIKSVDGVLRGVIELIAEERQISFYNGGIYSCIKPVLRTYHGYKGWNTDPANRVTKVGVASPGPLLRTAVGETVELIFLNRIDTKLFPRSSVTSTHNRCDTLLNLNGTEKYPGKDVFPNCFHASHTSNLHFHGTHVSPGGFEDNVLVGVIPNPSMDARVAIQQAIDAYGEWAAGGNPTEGLIAAAAAQLNVMVARARADNNKELVAQLLEAIHANHQLAENHEWPQYWPGLYPHRFTFPVYTKGGKFEAGQAPGTHWYHCHQHGSTTIQILNGMAGVLIVTGDYDDKILRIGGGTPANPKIKEQVLMLQLFAEQPNLLQNAPTPAVATMACNGQVLPTVTMKKGEVQFWRIANAAMRAHGIENYAFIPEATYKTWLTTPPPNGAPPVFPPGSIPVMNQTAQDGVQFSWENYTRHSNLPYFPMSPGNRADFLVKAPPTAGTMYFVFLPPAGGPPPIKDIQALTIFKLVVSGEPNGAATSFPSKADYPELPEFLSDIEDRELRGRHRTLTFSASGGPGTQPVFKIDDEQFNEGQIDQIMLLGTAEEWTLANTSLVGVTHPFHIHINPFQITEVFDPFTMKEPLKLPKPWIWGDVIGIPAGVQKVGSDGKLLTLPDGTPDVTAGYIKIRSRFVDFPGKFVLHCHILGHEDRGMMQLIEVVDNKTVVKHH